MTSQFLNYINYFLSDHPTVAAFRWSVTDTWGSTWSFLIFSIFTYISTAVVLHLFLRLIRRRRPVPLGPIPAIHCLALFFLFTTIFAGILSSAITEIHETRWFWNRRSKKTPFQWLLCFPIGTRSSGRVFFWSYIFYLSRFLHILRTFFTILRRRKLCLSQVFNHCTLIFMSFLWLEFSQSSQVMEILVLSLSFAIIYGYRFLTEIGLLPRLNISSVVNFHVVLSGINVIGHLWVLLLHFSKGGCNGMGSWVFDSLLNGVTILLFLKFYTKFRRFSKTEFLVSPGGDSIAS